MTTNTHDAASHEAVAAFEHECRAVMADALHDVQGALARSADLVRRAGADSACRALAHVTRSHAQCYAGDLAGGLATLDAIASLAPELDPRLQALMANAAVQPLMRLGRLEEANAAARRAVDAAERLGVNQEIAKALLSLGATERMLGRTDHAATLLTRAEHLAGADEALTAAAAGNLAECLLDLDRFEDALTSFSRAAAVFEKVGRRHAAAISRGNTADVLGRLGRIDQAMLAFEQARRAFEANGAALDAARLSCEEAEMLSQAGALRAARDRYAAALPILERAGAGADLTRARLALGSVLVALGDARSARTMLEAAALAAPEDSIILAEATLALARCDSADGRPAAAEARLSHVIPAMHQRPARAARARLALAHVLLEQGRAAEAHAHAEHAVAAIHDAGLDCLTPLATATLARTAAARHDDAAALRLSADAFDGAARLIERTTAPAGRAGLAHAYADLAALHVSMRLAHTPEAAPDAIVRADEVLASTPDPAWLRNDTDTSREDETRDLRVRLERTSLAITQAQLHAGAFPETQEQERLATLQAEAALLMERLQSASVGHAETLGNAETVSRSLPAATAIVHWFQDGGALAAMSLRPDAPPRIVRDLMPRAELGAVTRRLAFIAAEAAAADAPFASLAWDRALDHLRARLLDPLELPPTHRVTFNCPPWTQGVPWLALRPHSAVSFSLRDALRTPSRPSESPRVVLLATDDPSLPMAPHEVREAAGAWTDVDVQVGGRTDDLLDRVRHADVLHLATHGVFVPDRPGMSRFLLGDGWVTVQELSPAVRPGAVVVLSACHAGRSGGLAEDCTAIPGALRRAGAHAVVAPIWPLGDRSAASLFLRFHRHLATTWHTPHAVRTALAEAVNGSLRHDAASTEVHGVLVCGGVAC